MLISDWVKVKWHNNTKNHFESKGYIFTKYGDEFLVKIEDLNSGSNINILIQCDYCGEIVGRIYQTYLNIKEKEIINKDSCKKCRSIKTKESNLIRYNKTHLLKHDFEFVKQKFEEKDFILLENEYIGVFKKMKYICKKHPQHIQEIDFHHLLSGRGCKYCKNENISKKNKLNVREKSSGWNGGTSEIGDHLRKHIKQWKKDSIENCNYKCIVTGDRFDVVHHLHSFNMILQETFNILKLPIYQIINQYTTDELNNIISKFIELHYKYGLGVCLSKEIHMLFHNIFGMGNNTPEQFEEFTQRYYNGEFVKLLNT